MYFEVKGKEDYEELTLSDGTKVKISKEDIDLCQYVWSSRWQSKRRQVSRRGLKSEGLLWKKMILLNKVILERETKEKIPKSIKLSFKNGDSLDYTRGNICLKAKYRNVDIDQDNPQDNPMTIYEKIPLYNRSYKIKVSTEDYEYLSQFEWRVNPEEKVYRNRKPSEMNKKKFIYMSRDILSRMLGRQLSYNEIVRHITTDTLNYTRQNLKLITCNRVTSSPDKSLNKTDPHDLPESVIMTNYINNTEKREIFGTNEYNSLINRFNPNDLFNTSNERNYEELVISNGQKVKISKEDIDLDQFTWFIRKRTFKCQIFRRGLTSEGSLWNKVINLGKVILERKLGIELRGMIRYDHKNGDSFDFTRENIITKVDHSSIIYSHSINQDIPLNNLTHKEIPLLPDEIYKTKVSIEDYEYLSQFEWRITNKGRVHRFEKSYEALYNRKCIFISRDILSRMLGRQLLPNERSRYINHDLLDNTRENLKLVTLQCSPLDSSISESNRLVDYLNDSKKRKIIDISKSDSDKSSELPDLSNNFNSDSLFGESPELSDLSDDLLNNFNSNDKSDNSGDSPNNFNSDNLFDKSSDSTNYTTDKDFFDISGDAINKVIEDQNNKPQINNFVLSIVDKIPFRHQKIYLSKETVGSPNFKGFRYVFP